MSLSTYTPKGNNPHLLISDPSPLVPWAEVARFSGLCDNSFTNLWSRGMVYPGTERTCRQGRNSKFAPKHSDFVAPELAHLLPVSPRPMSKSCPFRRALRMFSQEDVICTHHIGSHGKDVSPTPKAMIKPHPGPSDRCGASSSFEIPFLYPYERSSAIKPLSGRIQGAFLAVWDISRQI